MDGGAPMHTAPPIISLDDGPGISPAAYAQVPRTPTTPQPGAHVINVDEETPPRNRTEIADKIVLEYLRKRGYRQAEAALQSQLGEGGGNVDMAVEEADVDEDIRNVVMLLKRPEELADLDARRYEDSYGELRDWVDGSLDIYKSELHSVLYPFLVHCFLEMVRLEHGEEARRFLRRCGEEFLGGVKGEEVRRLMGVSLRQHLEENETAKLFLENRYEIHLSSYAFELVVSFLADDVRRAVLLRILNRRCRVKVDVEGKERGAKDGFVAMAEKSGLLKEDVMWGRLRKRMWLIPDGGEKKKKKEEEEEEEFKVREDGTITESKVPLKKYRMGAAGVEARMGVGGLDLGAEREAVRADLSILCYTLKNGKEGVNCCNVSEDGSMVVAGFSDSSVRVWDAKVSGTRGGGLAGKPTRLTGHGGPVYSVEWTGCGRFILSGSEDGTVRLWNLPLKTDVCAYRGHNYPVWSVGLAPLGHYFASGGHDRTARIWTTDRTFPVRILAGHLADVDVVRWHPNCNYIATGSSDRTARLWDVREGKCVRVFGAMGGTVHSLAFAPDGKSLACGGDGKDIEVWDIPSGKRLQRLQGHKGTVWSLDYSGGGGVLASAGADCAVCVWDAVDWSRIIGEEEDEQDVKEAKENGVAEGTEKDGKEKEGKEKESKEKEGKEKEGKEKEGKEKEGKEKESKEKEGKEKEGKEKEGKEKDGNGKEKEVKGNESKDVEMKDKEGKESNTEAVANGKPEAKGDQTKDEEKTTAALSLLAAKRRAPGESLLIGRYETKETPIQTVRFSNRNLLIALGSFGS